MTTHEVVQKRHVRVQGTDENGDVVSETFEVGDEIEPTDAELASFPDRFRELPGN